MVSQAHLLVRHLLLERHALLETLQSGRASGAARLALEKTCEAD
jgi:hypothetical protein